MRGVVAEGDAERAVFIFEPCHGGVLRVAGLVDLMKRAGCAITPEEVHVSPELLAEGLRWHSYMRYRVLITRLLPMIGVDPMDYID